MALGETFLNNKVGYRSGVSQNEILYFLNNQSSNNSAKYAEIFNFICETTER